MNPIIPSNFLEEAYDLPMNEGLAFRQFTIDLDVVIQRTKKEEIPDRIMHRITQHTWALLSQGDKEAFMFHASTWNCLELTPPPSDVLVHLPDILHKIVIAIACAGANGYFMTRSPPRRRHAPFHH